ncbi:major DNA binding protein [Elephant endotheliotropic herpesvirus 5B]|uniref:Single-stranded DNA-binding protein n=1 Tax=Elephant endotheliotropic herpesvirus 5 TaxID=768738 RepID=A0A075CXU1_9BETA|nr:single-stranded DNA-binding protein [Elephant endotheliotropic herpesvirus 5]AHC02836.1 single-stranded DNA-binding protein [Elephant endotheliotropic herpesvirus 5]UVZ35236.1 major DNA binding protein [Elephant endotheliotropic herpesvirus 5B]
MSDDSNVASGAPTGHGAWIYITEKNDEIIQILSRLVLTSADSSVAIAPLLYDVTVESGFELTVKCPLMLNDNSVILKLSNFIPSVFIINSLENEEFRICEDVVGNISDVCEGAASRYGYTGDFTEFTGRTDTTDSDIRSNLNVSDSDYIVYIACTYGYKELLYKGYLIPHWQDVREISIGNRHALKIPLLSPFLFTQCRDDNVELTDPFVLERGFYNAELTKTLYSYIFRPIAVSLRYLDVSYLISASLNQYINDVHASAKLCDRKIYTCHGNNKLSNGDRDILALCDILANEVAFSYLTPFLDSAYDAPSTLDFYSWPIIKDKSHSEVLEQLDKFMLHISVHIGTLVFSANSILYQNKLAKTGGQSDTSNGQSVEGLLKSIHHTNGIQLLYDDGYDDTKCLVRQHTPKPKNLKFNLDHLAFGASFSSHVLTKLVWFLNRCEEYKTTQSVSSTCYLVINSSAGTCTTCDGKHCNTCIGALMCRMATRFPNVNRQQKKEPCVTTLLTRMFADMSMLGAFGKKYNTEREPAQKDGRGVSAEPLDRAKYFLNIIDYCKRESLLDTECNDIIKISGKQEFVKVVSGLNRTIDDELLKLLADMRKHASAKDDLANSTMSFTLDLNPHCYAFSPLFQFVYLKTVTNVLENLALVVAVEKITSYPLTQTTYSRWVKQHFQSVYSEFKKSICKKGFITLTDYKMKNTTTTDTFIDFPHLKREYSTDTSSRSLNTTSYQCRLWNFNVSSFRDFRIKYKPIPKNRDSPYFQKADKGIQNPVCGPLSFLITKFHKEIFPNVNVSPMTLWQRIYSNTIKNFNVDLGDKADVEAFIKFMFEQTVEYEGSNSIDMRPENLLQYIEFRFVNRLLHASGHRGQYIGVVQSLCTTLSEAKVDGFPCYLDASKTFSTLSEYHDHCKEYDGRVMVGRTRPYSNTNGMFEKRPLVTVAYALEKYPGASGNANIFHCGQLGYFSGTGIDKNLGMINRTSDYNFMRRKHIFCTPLTDVLFTKISRGAHVFDFDVLKQRIKQLLDEHSGGFDIELVVLSEILKHVKEPNYADLLFITNYQEHIASSLFDKIKVLDELEVSSYSIETLQEIFSEKEESDTVCTGSGYDFSFIIPKATDVEESGGLNIQEFTSIDDDNTPLVKRMRL